MPGGSDISIEVGDRHNADGAITGKTAVVLDRAGNRAWSGEGVDASEATTEAVRKFVGDRRAREYVG